MDVGCEALGAGTSRSDRPLAAANGRKPHAGQPSGTVHVLDAVALESAMERWGDTVLRLATSRMGSVADGGRVSNRVHAPAAIERAVHRRRASEGVASARDDQLLQRRAPQPLEQAPRRA